MRKLLLILSLVVLTCVNIFAQNKTISGTVIGDDGLPIIGAAVMVKGTTVGTITDMDGKYRLNAPANAETLVFRFVGMSDLELAIGSQTTIDATMQSDAQEIDEVVAVAYGTVKKSSFSGAATQVNGEKLQKMQVSNISKGLEGAVAGLQVASSSGTPGAGASIIIRGLGSINSSQSPLIVVDGVPYEGSLNSIPTQDIDALTVLKDAAANSMYGARGSNGVIIITTKGSKAQAAQINFEARYGYNDRGVSAYDIITDPGQYYEMAFESIRNSLVSELGSYGAANAYAAKNLISEYLKYNVYSDVADDELIDPTTGKLNPNAKKKKWSDDWSVDPFEKGIRQEYTLNVTGGNETTQAYASIGYLSDEGYMVGSSFDRISGRLKVDQKVGRHVKFGANVAYANTKQRTFGDTESNYSNIFMFSQQIAPIYPIYLYDKDGKKMYDEKGNVRYDFGTEYIRPYASQQNPYAVAKENIQESLRDNVSSRGYIEFNFLDDFKFTVNAAYDVFNTNSLEFATPIGGDAENVGGRGYRYATRNGALNVNQILNWNHNFAGMHDISVLAGHETKNDKYKYFYGQMTNFAYPNNPDFANASLYQDMTSYSTEYALEGVFLKADYILNEKYFLTASIRRDGSSRFDADKRWGSFWAVGGSWKLSAEEFMAGIEAIDFLKIKASYGTQGNDNIGYTHTYSDLYSVNRVDGAPAFTKVFRGNKDLTWEKSNNFNVGFEGRFLNLLTVNADFFIKETKDMLYAHPLAVSEGSPTTILRNEMDMKNTGFEIEVNADIIKTKDIRWNLSFNATHYKNELTKLPEGKPDSGYRAGSYWRKKGGSLYDFYMYDFAGINPENGAAQYKKYAKDDDGNETGEFELVDGYSNSGATLHATGKSAIPDLTGGATTTLEAFGFDFTVATAFQFGGYVSDSFYGNLMSPGDAGHNFHKDMFKRWTPNNTNASVPALNYQNQDENVLTGTALLTKANYFSLRNITLGYSLPKELLSKVHVDRLRVYLTGDNLWLKSERKGLDPRQGFGGGTGYVYSAMKTFSLGVNLTF